MQRLQTLQVGVVLIGSTAWVKEGKKLGHELDSDSHCYDPNQILTCTLISERFYAQRLQTFVSLVLIFNTTGAKKGHDVNKYIRMYCKLQ